MVLIHESGMLVQNYSKLLKEWIPYSFLQMRFGIISWVYSKLKSVPFIFKKTTSFSTNPSLCVLYFQRPVLICNIKCNVLLTLFLEQYAKIMYKITFTIYHSHFTHDFLQFWMWKLIHSHQTSRAWTPSDSVSESHNWKCVSVVR